MEFIRHHQGDDALIKVDPDRFDPWDPCFIGYLGYLLFLFEIVADNTPAFIKVFHMLPLWFIWYEIRFQDRFHSSWMWKIRSKKYLSTIKIIIPNFPHKSNNHCWKKYIYISIIYIYKNVHYADIIFTLIVSDFYPYTICCGAWFFTWKMIIKNIINKRNWILTNEKN